MPRRRHLALALAATLTLGACSSDPYADPAAAAASVEDGGAVEPTAPPATAQDGGVLIATLPDPVAGLITIDGTRSSLAGRANPAYVASSANRLELASTGESRAFQRLCVGEVDVVDSARPISPTEWEGCQAQGLDIVQFQVAADALILAIKNETDVGGDCLDTTQVSQIFGAGSTVANWSQVGTNFDDVPLRTGGPDIDTGELSFFGRAVLNSPDPSLSNFADTYRTFADDTATRDFVVGSLADALNSSRYLPAVAPRREQFRLLLEQALRVLDDARTEVAKTVQEQTEGIADERPPAGRAADDARVTAAYAARREAVVEVNRLRAVFGPLDQRFRRLRAAAARVDATTGSLGLFPQSYYAAYENLLRPFEIELADGDGQPNCIFPSPQTIINGQYPLSRQLLLTTTTRSLMRSEVTDYLEFYLRNAATFAAGAQAIAVPASEMQAQLDQIDTRAYPVFASVDGGPVEVQETPVVGLNDPGPAPVENPAR